MLRHQWTTFFLIEDDPYGELRFSGRHRSSFKQLMPDNTILLGSFSKIIVPGFRIGWLVAPDQIIEKLIIAKQATDLHSCQFTQNIILQYLTDNDLDSHIGRIISAYSGQCEAMLTAIAAHFRDAVECTRPEGGMFLWASLPHQLSALALFDIALEEGVVFVPGDPFYINQSGMNTMRLSFSSLDQSTIAGGIEKIGRAIGKLPGI